MRRLVVGNSPPISQFRPNHPDTHIFGKSPDRPVTPLQDLGVQVLTAKVEFAKFGAVPMPNIIDDILELESIIREV